MDSSFFVEWGLCETLLLDAALVHPKGIVHSLSEWRKPFSI